MKIEGRISILVSSDFTRIEITDDKANTRFLEIKLNPEQFTQCLSRLSMVPCEIELRGIEKLGKTHENKDFEFRLPDSMTRYNVDREKLAIYAKKVVPEGWESDTYFNSQNSFINKKGIEYARCTIRRWI